MKKQNIIIIIVAILVVAGIAAGVYFATKSDNSSSGSNYAYSKDPLRSGSLLDRLKAEQEAGLYGKKDNTADTSATNQA